MAIKTTKNGEVIIEMDVTDWAEFQRQTGITPKDKADAMQMLSDGYDTAQVAKVVIVCQEMGETVELIIPESKSVLLAGGMARIATMAGMLRTTTTVGKAEKEIEHRALVPDHHGKPAFMESEEEEEKDDGGGEEPIPIKWFPGDSEEAGKSARQYLVSNVMGRIRNGLAVIAVSLGVEEMHEVASLVRQGTSSIEEDLQERWENGDEP
jgi:hypothetical protein